MVATMTTEKPSRQEARRRAREAGRRANEKRAEREKALIHHAGELIYHLGAIAQVDQWKRDRLAQLRAQVGDEAARRLAESRAAAGARVAAMHQLGETLSDIAERTNAPIGVVRTLLRHAPKPQDGSSEERSGALGAPERPGAGDPISGGHHDPDADAGPDAVSA